MEKNHLNAVLKAAEATAEGDWSILAEHRTLSLHAASGGVGLNITQIRRVRVDDALLWAETVRGETFFVTLSEVFAAAVVDGAKKGERKAGFR